MPRGCGNLSSRRRLTDDERDGFAAFVARHREFAEKQAKYHTRLAPRYVRESDMVADIATDALVVAFLNHDERSEEQTHVARQVWWYAAAAMRLEKRRTAFGLTNHFVDDVVTDDGWQYVDADDLRDRMLGILTLPLRAVMAGSIAGMTFAEMQPKLGLSKGGVYSRYTSALGEVRDFFRRQLMEIA